MWKITVFVFVAFCADYDRMVVQQGVSVIKVACWAKNIDKMTG
jgi:hypothetical protein